MFSKIQSQGSLRLCATVGPCKYSSIPLFVMGRFWLYGMLHPFSKNRSSIYCIRICRCRFPPAHFSPPVAPTGTAYHSSDLGNYRCRPTHYSFSHRADKDAPCFARTWEIHGSTDGVVWDGLRRHENDTTLNSQQLSATWTIPEAQQYYRAFRIALDPAGNCRGTHALVACCFELYGSWYCSETGKGPEHP